MTRVRTRGDHARLALCALVLAGLVAGCDGDVTDESATERPAGGEPTTDDPQPACGPFGDWESSPYVLPYPVGRSHVVSQANCSGFGHSGFWTYGYDFIMEIGTTVTAARAGVVTVTYDGTEDGDPAGTNLITIRHDDGTVALYSHLTLGGVLVRDGQRVEADDTIGLSGNTGNTGGLPHLHFSVHPCNGLPGLPFAGSCPSRPVNFRNTDPNPEGLESRRAYRARPF